MLERWDVNADSLPILVTTAPREFSSQGIDQYQVDYLAVLVRREPLVSIVDTRACAGFMRSENRRYLARFGDATAEARRGVVQGIVVVTTDVLFRASIRAMHWQAKPEQPVAFVGTSEEAVVTAIEMLEARGVPILDPGVPARALAQLRRTREQATG